MTEYDALRIRKTSKAVTNLLGHGKALRIGDGGEFLLLEFLHGVLVISQIQLGAHKDDGSVGTMVSNFRIPLNNNKLIHQSLTIPFYL